jgi:hypothetical protein
MRWSQLSLYYLFSYLLAGGAALVAAPDLALKLLLSTGDYGPVFPRMSGMLMMALGVMIFQIVRHNIHSLYPTAIFVRVMLCAGLIVFYIAWGDPLFLTLLAIVGLGVILTSLGYWTDKKAGAAG